MSKTLIKTPGKTANKIPVSGKKTVSAAKSSTLYTTDMNQIIGSMEPEKKPKTPKLIKPVISTKQISGVNIENVFRKYASSSINSKDIDYLLQLKYPNGIFIINDKDKDVTIEIIGMLNIYPIDYILDFLSDSPNKEWIFWEQQFMNIGKVSVEREIFINRAEEIGVKGVGKCRFCTGTELVFAQKQVNSGDEPMKVYVRCITCNQHWKQG